MKKNEIYKLANSCEYYNDNPIYQSFRSLEELPIIDKTVVRDNYQKFIVDESLKNPIIRETSGSTGTIIKVIWNAIDYYASLKPIWKIRKNLGVSVSDYYVTDHSWITNIPINPNVKIFIERNRISLSKVYVDDSTIESYCRIIYQYRPTWMMVSPTFAIMLGNFCKKNEIILDFIKLIELSGEYVSDECHQIIEELFRGTPIRNQYGMTECNVIAYESDSNNILEVCSDNLLEILDDNGEQCSVGEIGNIVITNLPNKNMPLIRYKTGDMAKLCKKSCGCIRFKIVSSRETDYYQFENKRFHSSLFYCVVQQYNSRYEDVNIDQFLFVDEIKGLTAYIHVKDGRGVIEEWKIKDRLEAIFQQLFDINPKITLIVVNDIPRISNKKNYFTLKKPGV